MVLLVLKVITFCIKDDYVASFSVSAVDNSFARSGGDPSVCAPKGCTLMDILDMSVASFCVSVNSLWY